MTDFRGDGLDGAGLGPRAAARARERAEQQASEQESRRMRADAAAVTAAGAVDLGAPGAVATSPDPVPLAARPAPALPVNAPAPRSGETPTSAIPAARPPLPGPEGEKSSSRGNRRPRRPGAGAGDGGKGSGGDRPTPSSPSAGGFFVVLRELTLVVVIALGLSLVIKTFLVQAFFIPSVSMEDTLKVGDRVLVTKLTPGPFDLRRGDIVVFKDPGGWLNPTVEAPQSTLNRGVTDVLTFVGLLPADSGEHLIKRVIGLPGDTVACCDAQGRLTVNGVPIEEPYVYPGNDPSTKEFKVTVPAGRLWVMGDHREVSEDSRFHPPLETKGTVPVEDVVGRAFVIVWPFGRAELLDRPKDTFSKVPAP